MTDARQVTRSLGPFEFERQAATASARIRGERNTPERAAYIVAALANAVVGIGDYDLATARWLAGVDHAFAATVLDWVARAFEGGVQSGAQVFHLTATLNRPPTDAEIDALYEAGLSDSGISYGETTGEMDVDRVAYSRAEAAATIAEQVAAVPGLEVVRVQDTPEDWGV